MLKCLGVGEYYHIRDKRDTDCGCCDKCIAFSTIEGVTQYYYNTIQYYRINKIMNMISDVGYQLFIYVHTSP